MKWEYDSLPVRDHSFFDPLQFPLSFAAVAASRMKVPVPEALTLVPASI